VFQNAAIADGSNPSVPITTGSFFYNAATTTFTNWNIVLPATLNPFPGQGGVSALTYNTTTSSIVSSSSTSVLFNYTDPFPTPPTSTTNFRRLLLLFNSPLTSTVGETISFDITGTNNNRSQEQLNNGANISTFRNFTAGSVRAVPLESDALPIVGSALFMAGGLWWKKKRAQAKVAEFVAKK
jgi:hypothetical protein